MLQLNAASTRAALIISERPQNIEACAQNLLLDTPELQRVFILSSQSKFKLRTTHPIEIVYCFPSPLRLQSILFSLASLNPIIIFCDNAISLLSERVITVICMHPSIFASCNIRRYSFLPSLSVKRNTKEYLRHGSGKTSFYGMIKRSIHLLQRKLIGASFVYLSYPNDKCTYICPDYGRIVVSQSSSICGVRHISNRSYTLEICFLYGNEEQDLLSSKLFLEAFTCICQKFKGSIKLHPRTSPAKRALINRLENKIGRICVKDNSYWSNRYPAVGIAIASSALFTLDFKVRISLSALLFAQCQSRSHNIVHPYVYHRQLSRFFHEDNVCYPENVQKLTSILFNSIF